MKQINNQKNERELWEESALNALQEGGPSVFVGCDVIFQSSSEFF